MAELWPKPAGLAVSGVAALARAARGVVGPAESGVVAPALAESGPALAGPGPVLAGPGPAEPALPRRRPD